jgi:hypothetical protein
MSTTASASNEPSKTTNLKGNNTTNKGGPVANYKNQHKAVPSPPSALTGPSNVDQLLSNSSAPLLPLIIASAQQLTPSSTNIQSSGTISASSNRQLTDATNLTKSYTGISASPNLNQSVSAHSNTQQITNNNNNGISDGVTNSTLLIDSNSVPNALLIDFNPSNTHSNELLAAIVSSPTVNESTKSSSLSKSKSSKIVEQKPMKSREITNISSLSGQYTNLQTESAQVSRNTGAQTAISGGDSITEINNSQMVNAVSVKNQINRSPNYINKLLNNRVSLKQPLDSEDEAALVLKSVNLLHDKNNNKIENLETTKNISNLTENIVNEKDEKEKLLINLSEHHHHYHHHHHHHHHQLKINALLAANNVNTKDENFQLNKQKPAQVNLLSNLTVQPQLPLSSVNHPKTTLLKSTRSNSIDQLLAAATTLTSSTLSTTNCPSPSSSPSPPSPSEITSHAKATVLGESTHGSGLATSSSFASTSTSGSIASNSSLQTNTKSGNIDPIANISSGVPCIKGNLNTIVEAIIHVEGKHLLEDLVNVVPQASVDGSECLSNYQPTVATSTSAIASSSPSISAQLSNPYLTSTNTNTPSTITQLAQPINNSLPSHLNPQQHQQNQQPKPPKKRKYTTEDISQTAASTSFNANSSSEIENPLNQAKQLINDYTLQQQHQLQSSTNLTGSMGVACSSMPTICLIDLSQFSSSSPSGHESNSNCIKLVHLASQTHHTRNEELIRNEGDAPLSTIPQCSNNDSCHVNNGINNSVNSSAGSGTGSSASTSSNMLGLLVSSR